MFTPSPIYRNPPYVIGPSVQMAQDGGDKVDWGLAAQGIPDEWKSTRGKGILVGIADTGRPTHPDVADAVVKSRNFSQSHTDEDIIAGHGTHVAGIIAARHNGTGVVGVAPECQLATAKVLGDDGSGTNFAVAQGVQWLHEIGCRIINMSLGGAFDRSIAAAIKAAVDDGVIVICAAGNRGNIAGVNTVEYPARLPYTTAVGSYNKAGRLSSYSARGPQVHVAFPGEDILSTWLNGEFRRLSGTSMATPFCSGVVALSLAHDAAKLAAGEQVDQIDDTMELISRIKLAAMDKGAPGKDRDWGWGIVDVDKFIRLSESNTPIVPAPGDSDAGDNDDDEMDFGFFRVRYPARIGDNEGVFIYLA